ncbi:MAG: 3'-5' exonuclease [Acidobacteria bacterium]|nr:3'-5' exonuclease [Acidobacteriota bacterium]
MISRNGNAPHEKISVLLPLLHEALRQRGSLSSEQACGLLFKAGKVHPEIARRLMEAALEGDRRFTLLEDGSVCLAPRPVLPSWNLDQGAFTVVDLETTGGSAADRILEVGAVRVEQNRPTREFSSLLNPGIPIPPTISSMTGIQAAMVADAPSFHQIAEALLEFVGDSVLVAHNLPFDLGFLNRALSRSRQLVLANPCLCTVRLGRRLLSHLPDRRLDTVAEHYGISIGERHRALGDARATALILIRFVGELAERGIWRMDQLEAFLAEKRESRAGEGVTGTRRKRRPAQASPPNAES